MFLAFRAERLSTLPFTTPGVLTSAAVTRWTLASTSGWKASPSFGVMPMATTYLDPNTFSTRFVAST